MPAAADDGGEGPGDEAREAPEGEEEDDEGEPGFGCHEDGVGRRASAVKGAWVGGNSTGGMGAQYADLACISQRHDSGNPAAFDTTPLIAHHGSCSKQARLGGTVLCPSCATENRDDATFCGECGAALSSERPCPACARPHPPSAGGPSQVRRSRGGGGRKRVYLAHDTKLDRDGAIAAIKTEGLDEA